MIKHFPMNIIINDPIKLFNLLILLGELGILALDMRVSIKLDSLIYKY